MFRWWRQRRRRETLAAPVPEGWRSLLERSVPFFVALPPDRQEHLLHLAAGFLAEHPIVGAGGLELTEEIRVVVAACAARLILDLDLAHYERLTEVVVYPYDELVDPRDDRAMLGVAHRHGAVVLSWPAVQRGLRAPHDGRDTAAHEFAHALDLADGVFDAAPALRASEDYRPWAAHLGAAFARLQEGDRTLLKVLRPYGATAPEEFFAVATEVYFERPDALRRAAPDVYTELARFYGAPDDAASPDD